MLRYLASQVLPLSRRGKTCAWFHAHRQIAIHPGACVRGYQGDLDRPKHIIVYAPAFSDINRCQVQRQCCSAAAVRAPCATVSHAQSAETCAGPSRRVAYRRPPDGMHHETRSDHRHGSFSRILGGMSERTQAVRRCPRRCNGNRHGVFATPENGGAAPNAVVAKSPRRCRPNFRRGACGCAAV